MGIPVTGVVPIELMVGDDEADTALLRQMSVEAKNYLESFDWCEVAEPAYWGGGVGKIFSAFLFEIVPRRADIDRWLWVVVGDIPHLYLTLDVCGTASEVLDVYLGLMDEWVELARRGQASPDLPPTGVEPTPEWAADLDRRLEFIRANIRPFLKG